MNILLIPDKFKGSLTAQEVINAIIEGIYSAMPKATIHSVLASDGGDGFLDSVLRYVPAAKVVVKTVDPLGRQIGASYLFHQGRKEAFVEMAKASGLVLLKDAERNPMSTSTYGTGIQIRDAAEKGAKRIYVGLGGSATNDGGIGIAKAIGYRFLDVDGNDLEPIGKNLIRINSIDISDVSENLDDISLFAVNDVNNTLFGPNGAAYVYAEQKGADMETIEKLDHGLRNLDAVVQSQLKKKYAHVSGAGAAGGTAYGLKTFLKAEFINGIDFILQLAETLKLLEKQSIDLIITGEGKIDSQTMSGKLIHGVLELGKQCNIPVIAVCGMLDTDETDLKKEGLQHVLEVQDRSKPLVYNMKNASRLIKNKISGFFKTYNQQKPLPK